MIKVGVIGLGMMGTTHLDVYSKRGDVEVLAVSDVIPERLEGKEIAAGNIEGQAQGGFDFSRVRKYPEGKLLIADDDVELVDICLWTQLHSEYAIEALRRGKHVIVEKPLARTHAEAQDLVGAAAKAEGLSMCAMCMRFWPGWTWLKEVVEKQTYGKVLGAQFRRVTTHPGGPFYSDGKQCGGAILDLHIHDTDFVQYCFGMPRGVYSFGYTGVTGEPDHLVTRYIYDEIPLVVAEGGWSMAAGFGFEMQYAVNFEQATATFDISKPEPLRVVGFDDEEIAVDLEPGMGYEREIAYFLDCIREGRHPETVTPASAADSVRIVEAEKKSIETGQVVYL
jgi:predicted dehydrogenase